MAQRIVKGIEQLLSEANRKIEHVSASEARSLHGGDTHIFVDLRDIRELRREGKIPGAFSCPRGMLEFWIDSASPYHRDIFNQDKTYLFYCASGWRSALGAATAREMGLAPVAHIAGGFSAWREAGGPVEPID